MTVALIVSAIVLAVCVRAVLLYRRICREDDLRQRARASHYAGGQR